METAIEKRDVQHGLQLCDEINQIATQFPYKIGERCKQIKDGQFYPFGSTYTDFIVANTGYQIRAIQHFIAFKSIVDNLCIKSDQLVALPPEGVLRPLAGLKPELQKIAWEEAGGNGHMPTFETVKKIVEKMKVSMAQPKTKQGKPNKNVFNWTNECIDWAKWSWNPVTGCQHNCPYCYARDIGMRFDHHFKPTERLYRLSQPKTTIIPASVAHLPGIRNVFVCSMADLFGEWVPDEWIEKVLNAVRENPQWNYIFLTKNPKRLIRYEWPDHAWVGTTVDCQTRVESAEKAFEKIKAKVKFISAEPLSESLKFNRLELFNWVIIGSRSKSSKLPAEQPKWEWVENLFFQARRAGCKIYFKPNLKIVPKEYPGEEQSAETCVS